MDQLSTSLHVFRYLTAFILLWKLNNEVDLFSWNVIGDGVIRYLKSGWSISLMLMSQDVAFHDFALVGASTGSNRQKTIHDSFLFDSCCI